MPASGRRDWEYPPYGGLRTLSTSIALEAADRCKLVTSAAALLVELTLTLSADPRQLSRHRKPMSTPEAQINCPMCDTPIDVSKVHLVKVRTEVEDNTGSAYALGQLAVIWALDMESVQLLFESLKERRRPEDVAAIVLKVLSGDLTKHERSIISKAADGALDRNVFGYTSMAQSFAKVVGAKKQVAKASELFKHQVPVHLDADQARQVEAFVDVLSPEVCKEPGKSNFLTDRLPRVQRKAQGLDLSKRAYNKRWRLLKRLEQKVATMDGMERKLEFQRIAKHGLSHHINEQDFIGDKNTACFIAYYNARCNLRSEFTINGQQRPFDEISKVLLDRCTGTRTIRSFWGRIRTEQLPVNTTNWWAIAQVYPDQVVYRNLSDDEKGRLLGQWTSILQDIAQLLGELWRSNDIARDTMIVKRGNDSSTWNHTAGAWNKARDNWMNLIYALGMEYILDDLCFGKVLRLMAADVAAWHRLSGNGLDANTMVWNKVPLPWQVFSGEETCTVDTVKKACAHAGLDPYKSGWIAPREHHVAEFRPTPELVHGVTVSNPFLATVLKKHRYYSGKPGGHTFYPDRN